VRAKVRAYSQLYNDVVVIIVSHVLNTYQYMFKLYFYMLTGESEPLK